MARDIEANVERLIKVGLLAEHVRIPGFRLGDVFDVINGRVESDDVLIRGG